MTKWIIVVDDDTANLKMAGHILSKNNMRVTALKSGSSFLEYVNENGMPDLVLLDIKMPVMDGFETLEKLRQIEQQKGLMKTPVIFLTADEDVDTETRGFEVGVSENLSTRTFCSEGSTISCRTRSRCMISRARPRSTN